MLPAVGQAGIEGIAQTVTQQVKGEHGEHDGDAREDDQVGCAENAVLLLTEHQAPLRRRRLRSQPEEG